MTYDLPALPWLDQFPTDLWLSQQLKVAFRVTSGGCYLSLKPPVFQGQNIVQIDCVVRVAAADGRGGSCRRQNHLSPRQASSTSLKSQILTDCEFADFCAVTTHTSQKVLIRTRFGPFGR